MKKTLKRTVSFALLICLLSGVFCLNVSAAAQKKYGCKYGTVKTVKSDYKTDCTSFTVKGENGKIYLYFDAVDGFSNKTRSNIFYGFALYSDSDYKNIIVNTSGSFPKTDSKGVVPWDVTAYDSGVYYGIVYVWVKNSKGESVIDSDSIEHFTVDVNKVGASTPALSSVSVTAAGNRFTWGKVKYADKYAVYRKAGSETSWKKIETVTDCSYTDKNVEPGVKYYYTVKAYDGSYVSKYDKTGVYAVYLPAPVILNSEVMNNNGIKIAWQAVPGAGGYMVYKKQADGSYDRIAKVGSDVTEYTDYCKNMTGEQSFYYKVRAYSGITTGIISSPFKATILCSVSLDSASCAYGEVNLSWDSLKGADKYYIYKKADGGKWALVYTTKDKLSYCDIEIENGQTYWYSIRISKNGRLSSFTSKGLKVTNLGATKITSVKNSTDGSVAVSWKAVEGALGYNVYRRDSRGDFEYLGKTVNLTYNDTKEKNNNLKYIYTVEAFSENSLGEKEYVTSSVIYMAPPEITSLKAVSSGNQLKWSKVSGATAYTVYRKTPSGSWKKLATVEDTKSYTDKSAKKGTAYYYTVAAMNGKTEGSYSCGKAINCLDIPELTSAETQSSGNVKIKWNSVSGAKKYYVYIKTDSTSWKKLGSTTSLSYTDKSTKTSGEEYYYTVKAYDGKQSAIYDSLGQKVLYLSVPKLKIESSKGQNTLSWGAVSGAQSYTVYRRPVGGSFTTICKKTTSLSYKDTPPSGEYEYAVRAVSGSSRSGYMTVK